MIDDLADKNICGSLLDRPSKHAGEDDIQHHARVTAQNHVFNAIADYGQKLRRINEKFLPIATNFKDLPGHKRKKYIKQDLALALASDYQLFMTLAPEQLPPQPAMEAMLQLRKNFDLYLRNRLKRKNIKQ